MAIDLTTLNKEQKKAVIHKDGPLLIVAGAGTGKTTVITQRIGWLITEQNLRPDEILALTFTEKAAEEMEERVDKLLPYGYVDLWISTFHAFAEKILHLHALDIGLPNDFKLLNQTEQWMLMRQNLDRFDLDYYRPMGNPTKFIQALLRLFSRAKDDAITPEEYLDYAQSLSLNKDSVDVLKSTLSEKSLEKLSKAELKELRGQEITKTQEIANAYHVYQQLLLENNALDFGDLINYCLQLFIKRPAVLARYREQFKYILVDEFQDTNYAQYEMVKLLASPNNNVTVVGDDDQSVYKFRGASVSNILEFKRDYPKSTEVFLTQNYRSCQPILDLSYSFIQQNNPDRLEVKLAKAGKKTLTKKLSANITADCEIKHCHYQTAEDELLGVLQRINDIKEQNSDTTWNDFAILARTNDSAGMFAHALSQTNIPYRFLASRGLYTKPVILDILAYLRLLDNYHESGAVYRILNSPIFDLTHKNLVQLTYLARRKGYSLFAALQRLELVPSLSDEVRAKIRQFLGLVEKHTRLAREKSVGEIVLAFLEDSGYLTHITERPTAEMVQSTSFLNQFYRKLTQFEQSTPHNMVKDFLSFIDLEMEAGETGSLEQNLDEGPEAVKVMTVHAAKGLEFKYVFIVHLVDRKFPTDNRPDPLTIPDALVKEQLPEGDAHLQEERRLLYVAITRAKEHLYFTSASDYGGARAKKLSRFLVELGSLGLTLDTEKAIMDKMPKPTLSMARTPIKSDDVSYLLPKKFSFTQLMAFQKCPYHYWLEYILKIPQKGKSFFSFGSSMHLTLQHFFMLVKERSQVMQPDLFGQVVLPTPGQPLVSETELMELFEKKWIDDWYNSRREHDEYKKNGRRMMEEFYAEYVTAQPMAKLLETPFQLHIKDDETGDVHTIVGKMDRIDQTPEGLEIIDYKTGQGKTLDSLDADAKQQLMIYQLAAEEQLKEKVARLTYYYLETGERVSFTPTQRELDNFKKKVIKIINDIRAFPFPATPDQCTCRNQDLRTL